MEKVVGAVEPKSTTPVLSNVLLTVSEKGMVITGTDLDTEMTGYMDIRFPEARICPIFAIKITNSYG